MNAWMMALAFGRQRLQVTETFTANATWRSPVTTNRIETISGKGTDGTPATASTRSASVQGDTVTGYASGTGTTSGALTWGDFQADITGVVNAVNGGGSGFGNVVTYGGYPNSNTYTASLYQYTYANAVAGTAAAVLSPGWKTSGAVTASDYGFFTVSYTQNYTIPATTGASASGFGKTFPGGAGGPASTTVYSNVAVTPSTDYSIIVPAGGVVVITYYK